MDFTLLFFNNKGRITLALAFCYFILITSLDSNGQGSNKYSQKNWHLMDLAKDSVYGTSVNKAYAQLLKGKKSHQVIVAVIDTGLDTAHQDIQGHVWINKKEIPDNGIDDDHNGYVDDIHGWNFLGGKDGRNISNESYELDREYYRLYRFYNIVTDSTRVPFSKKHEYRYYLTLKKARVKDSLQIVSNINWISGLMDKNHVVDSIWRNVLNKDIITLKDVKNGIANSNVLSKNSDSLSEIVVGSYSYLPDSTSLKEHLVLDKEFLNGQQLKLRNYSIDPNAARRDIIGDDPFNIDDTNYGNNNIAAGIPIHGTHISGIITALRQNGIGLDGIADNVLIMTIRSGIIGGDERDKDIALSVKYAVNNGAKIINMSFGKPYSPGKKWVDDAVKYAAEKDVLIIHAAGNDSKSIDGTNFYPDPVYFGTVTKAPNFITVGASTGGPDSAIAASFSNYGHTKVDVFAPGENIYSAIPGNKYETYNGTSSAAPVVAGIAALILEYFPALTARQVINVIKNSVTKLPGQMVTVPGNTTKADFSDLSSSGGIVNAYNALKLAATLKGERKKIRLSK